MYSILLKELCLQENKSLSLLGMQVLARRNKNPLVIWARGIREDGYSCVSEKDEVLLQRKKSPCPTEHGCPNALANTDTQLLEMYRNRY